MQYCATSPQPLWFMASVGSDCPDTEPFACYGRTGAQILVSIGRNFRTINDENTWFEYNMLVFAMVVVVKCIHLLGFTLKCNQAQVPQPPQQRRVQLSHESSGMRGITLQASSTPSTPSSKPSARVGPEGSGGGRSLMTRDREGSCLSSAI